MRVFVTYIGSHDPYGEKNTKGPILSILDYLEERDKLPDRVLLLVTKTHSHEVKLKNGKKGLYFQEGMEEKAEEVMREIKDRYGDIEVAPLELSINPADLDEVLEETVKSLKSKIGSKDEIYLNVSSGTPAMSAIITFFADSGLIGYREVWQSLNPTKLPSEAVRIKRVKLGYLRERERLERALNLFNALDFRRAGEAFEEIAKRTLIPERRPNAWAFKKLMEIYELWDRAEFKDASDEFEKFKDNYPDLWESVPVLQEQLKVVRKLSQTNAESVCFLHDLYASILRRYHSGYYNNLSTRARRLYEGILNHLIYKSGLNPRGVRLSDLDKFGKVGSEIKNILKKRTDSKYFIKKGYKIKDVKTRIEIIKVLIKGGVLRFADFDELEREGEIINNIRGNSLEGHGLKPIRKKEAKRLVDLSTKLIEKIVEEPINKLKNHPFSPSSLQSVANRIRSLMKI